MNPFALLMPRIRQILFHWSIGAKNFSALRAYGQTQLDPKSKYIDYDSYLKAAQQIAMVYKCVSIIGESIYLKRFKVLDADNGEITKGPVIDLLKRPNPFMTGPQLREAMAWNLLLVGNNYTLKDDLIGNLPRELWQLPPQNVTIIPNRETFISGFVFRPNGASGRGDGMPFDAARVSHTKLPHPRDSWYGMGKIQASIMTYEIDNAAHLFSWKFFEQGAWLSGVLESENQMTEESFTRLKKEFLQEHQGVERMQKLALLEAGLKYKQTGVTQKDMEFLGTLKFTQQEILSIFGVPPAKAGIMENANYSNSEEQDLTYQRETIAPLVKRIDEQITKDIVMPFNPDWRVETDMPIFDDDKSESEVAQRYFALGAITPNEVRVEFLGLEESDTPGMNSFYLPVGLMPVDAMEEPAPQEGTEPPGEATPTRALYPRLTVSHMKRAVGRNRILLSYDRMKNRRRPKVRAALIAYFKDQQAAVIRYLREHGVRAKAMAVVKAPTSGFNWEGQAGKINNLMKGEFDATISASVDILNALTGSKLKHDDPKLSAARSTLANRVPRVNRTTRTDLDEVISLGVDRGYSLEQIIDGVSDDEFKGVKGVFTEATNYRAERIARTEISATWDRVSVRSYKDVGISTLDVIGCEGGPEGHTVEGEKYGCLSTGIPIDEADSIEFHPNHVGVLVPGRRG